MAGTPNPDRDQLRFAQHHAFIIGIDAYEHVSPLKTAAADARALAEVLAGQQHFQVQPPLIDARGSDIRALLERTLPAQVGPDDRVLFYFAGHGIAADGDDGPAGYIVPADADPADLQTFIPMAALQQALDALPCRHLLLILDCCFSGAFKWSSRYRAIGHFMPKKIYRERFERFIDDPAWQVITSAAYDQKALDVVRGIGKATGERGIRSAGEHGPHSPFAQALFQGLAGAADAKLDTEGDGVITATELYAYIRDQVEPQTLEAGQRLRQTPGFFPLRKHDKGEFIFLHPRHRLNLAPLPKRSPYKGLESFNEDDQLLFYGRDRVIEDLRAKAEASKLLVVSGASGTGKSSVVKAGLLPALRAAGHRILPVMRPGAHPLAALAQALDAARLPPGAPKAVLLIDQFEEVITRCADPAERTAFDRRLRELLDEDPDIHRLILTVRADFEPQLNSGALQAHWKAGRCTVPPFSLEELKQVIVMPTIQEVLIFEPPQLVDEIISEVVQAPGALPLLSYALAELYEAYRQSGRQDRALKKDDYDKLGGVMGALRTKADALYQSLDAPEQHTMRKILLRMVSLEGDLAGKRVPMDDLVYSAAENPLVAAVVEGLVDARLIAKGSTAIEPAHDALVRAWKTLHDWIHEAGKEKLILGAKLNAAANEYAETKRSEFLWHDNPHLLVLEKDLKQPQHAFNAREVAFIEKSVARRKRRTRITIGVTASLLLVLAVSTWVAVQGERNARMANADASSFANGLAVSVDQKLEKITGTDDVRRVLLDSVGIINNKLNGGDDIKSAAPFLKAILEGDVLLKQGDPAAAAQQFGRALQIAEGLVAKSPQDLEWQRTWAVSHAKLGEALVSVGDLEAARKHYGLSLDKATELLRRDPKNKVWRGDLSVGHRGMGYLEHRSGNAAIARDHYQASLALTQGQADEEPLDLDLQAALAQAHWELGAAEIGLERYPQARVAADAALRIGAMLTQQQPDNREWQHELSKYYRQRADIAIEERAWLPAREAIDQAIRLTEHLVTQVSPGHAQWQHAHFLGYRSRAELALRQGALADARKASDQALALARRLHEQDAGNPVWARERIVLYEQRADIEIKARRFAAARGAYGQGLEIAGRLNPADEGLVQRVCGAIEQLPTSYRRPPCPAP